MNTLTLPNKLHYILHPLMSPNAPPPPVWGDKIKGILSQLCPAITGGPKLAEEYSGFLVAESQQDGHKASDNVYSLEIIKSYQD